MACSGATLVNYFEFFEINLSVWKKQPCARKKFKNSKIGY